MSSAATMERSKSTTRGGKQKVTAETLAAKQRDISVSEFFAKNRHLLGFDNPRKALLTTVKEAVDNSLDACEEAGVLPDITVVIEDLYVDPASEKTGKGKKAAATEAGAAGGKPGKRPPSSRYRVTIVDNGPGIVRKQVENIFGRLLYGSKFHRLKMSRGQQGIGISAAGMYGLITTGRPMVIHTRPAANKPAHHIELAMNTKTNRAEVTVDDETEDFPPARMRSLAPRDVAVLDSADYPTGTSVSIELEGRYQRGRGSVDEFLELTAIANPHAKITFIPPLKSLGDVEDDGQLGLDAAKGAKGASGDAAAGETAAAAPTGPMITTEVAGITIFPRAVNELPPETQEIQPHPKGIELGILLQMLKDQPAGVSLFKVLQESFSRVSPASASAICRAIGVTTRTRADEIDHALAEKLFRELQEAKLPPPPTDCLAPIGVRQMLAGMLKGVRAEFYAASSRTAAVYRGRPFQIEAALAFGGDLPGDEPGRVIRFANRVPLLFQQSACSSFKAVTETSWKNYNLSHPRGALPVGPLVIMIHMASVWVPFTSESKEAIADYDEIRKEMKLALMECGRKLGTYLRKRQKMRREAERRDIFERYIGEIAQAINAINGTDAKKLYEALLEQARERTAVADQVLDDEGKVVKDEPSDDDGVIIVEQAARRIPGLDDGPPVGELSAAEAAALKVHALANAEDDESAAKGSKRSSKKTGKKGAKKSGGAGAAGGSSGKPGKAGPSAAAAKSPPQPEPKKPKPRMRVTGGGLVPVDEKSLFE